MFELTLEKWARHYSARKGHRNEKVSYLEVISGGGPSGVEKQTQLPLEELRKASKLKALMPEKQQEKLARDDWGLQESRVVLEALGRDVMWMDMHFKEPFWPILGEKISESKSEYFCFMYMPFTKYVHCKCFFLVYTCHSFS